MKDQYESILKGLRQGAWTVKDQCELMEESESTKRHQSELVKALTKGQYESTTQMKDQPEGVELTKKHQPELMRKESKPEQTKGQCELVTNELRIRTSHSEQKSAMVARFMYHMQAVSR